MFHDINERDRGNVGTGDVALAGFTEKRRERGGNKKREADGEDIRRGRNVGFAQFLLRTFPLLIEKYQEKRASRARAPLIDEWV